MKNGKTIVCFANSRKTGGSCIVGKEWLDGKPGKWVRPVSSRPTHEISRSESRYIDGRYPDPLDVFDLSCDKPFPVVHQRENILIDAKVAWKKQSALSWSDARKWVDDPPVLWMVGDGSSNGKNNRVCDSQDIGESVYLIDVKMLHILVEGKTRGVPDSKRGIMGEFNHRHVIYRMNITDPIIEEEYLKMPEGKYTIHDPLLCVSLAGEKYPVDDGHYYKFIAAVLHEERFK